MLCIWHLTMKRFIAYIIGLLLLVSCAEKKVSEVSEPLGENAWALVRHSVVPMRAAAGDVNEMVSQATMGTPIKLLAKQGNWFRVQTPDGYFGYMENTVLQLLTETEMQAWQSANDRYIYTAVGGWVYSVNDQASQVVCDVVEGCIFRAQGHDDEFLQITLPDGRLGYVLQKDCERFSSWGNCSPEEIDLEAVVADAKRLMGVPYLWGGASTKAIDCSGFTQLAFRVQGILLERDASLQQKYGEHIDASNLENLKVGDLLFFGKTERATHVGIYIGNTRFIHASGMVKVNSLDPTQPDYNEKRHKTLISAQRIGKTKKGLQVATLKQCDWYGKDNR